MTQALIQLPHAGEVGATHLYLPASLTKEKFLAVVGKLANVGHGYWWWIADAAMFGMHHFGPGTFEEIAAAVGCSAQFVESLARLARVYPVRDRVLGLSITHHRSASHLQSRTRRLKLLHIAKTRQLTADKVYQLARVREKRRVEFRFKVPLAVANDAKFLREAKDFFAVWKIVWWRSGTKRHQKARLEGRGQALLAG